jgi:malate:Na+ symporter
VLELAAGSVVAAIVGTLVRMGMGIDFVGRKFPSLTSAGHLQPGEHDEIQLARDEIATDPVVVSELAAAGMTAITLYVGGLFCHKLFGLPGPHSGTGGRRRGDSYSC